MPFQIYCYAKFYFIEINEFRKKFSKLAEIVPPLTIVSLSLSFSLNPIHQPLEPCPASRCRHRHRTLYSQLPLSHPSAATPSHTLFPLRTTTITHLCSLFLRNSVQPLTLAVGEIAPSPLIFQIPKVLIIFILISDFVLFVYSVHLRRTKSRSSFFVLVDFFLNRCSTSLSEKIKRNLFLKFISKLSLRDEQSKTKLTHSFVTFVHYEKNKKAVV